MVKPHDVIKRQNVQKLCINTLALPYATSKEKFCLVYLIYLNLFKDDFRLRDLGLSTARHGWSSKGESHYIVQLLARLATVKIS